MRELAVDGGAICGHVAEIGETAWVHPLSGGPLRFFSPLSEAVKKSNPGDMDERKPAFRVFSHSSTSLVGYSLAGS